MQFWQELTQHNTEVEWLIAALIFSVTLVIQLVVKKNVFGRLVILAKKTESRSDDLAVNFLNSLSWPVFSIIALYFAFKFLILPVWLDQSLNKMMLLIGICYALVLSHKIINLWTDKWRSKNISSGNGGDFTLLIRKASKIAIWLLAGLFFLSNLGINITALVTGLGLGGLAVGLAMQSTLKNFISAVIIHITKSFSLGDFIAIGDIKGYVKEVNWYTVRLKTLLGHEIIIPNKTVTEATIENFASLKRRREAITINVHADTSIEKLDQALDIIKTAIRRHKITKFDRAHYDVFGTYSVEFDVVFFVTPANFKEYKDVRQAIGREISLEFEKNGIKFAIPSQEVVIS